MRGVVASGHRCVSEAAAELLRAGGNAFDAAIAAGFASAVAEPALTSLGGGGFLLARTASAEATLFDFFVDTPGRGLPEVELEPHFVPMTVHFPGSDQVFNVGLGAATAPGNLMGFLHVHRRLGRLPLREVLAPAIQLARDGLELNTTQAYFLELLRPIMRLTAAGRSLFEPDGRYLRKGDRFANSELAAFLESLPRGGERDLYAGGLARRIASDMREGGGLITEADLSSYQVVERRPLVSSFRGCELLGNPRPSFGGSLLGLSLRLLGECEALESGPGSGAQLARLIGTMQQVDRYRSEGCIDPDAVSATALAESAARVRSVSGGTTHVSVCDVWGNAASMTTSNGEGSGYLVPGTGIMLNNMMGEDDLHPEGFHASPPGNRISSMMSPSLLLGGDRLRLVIGSGGSKRIRTAILQVLVHIVDHQLSVSQAVEASRVHWDGDRVQIEPGFEASSIEALRQRWPVNGWAVRDVYFGGVHAVSPDGAAGADPRRGGYALRVD